MIKGLHSTPSRSTKTASMTPLQVLRSKSPATHDDGAEEEDKNDSFPQIRASTDATGGTVDRLATIISDSSELEKKFQKDRLS